MTEDFKAGALRYHRQPVPGKTAISPTKALANKRDLALACSPGVAYSCEAIAEDPNEAASLTVRGNLVGVVTNGTAVLGLGAIGALASKAVMDETDPDKLVDIIALLEPTFGGENLEDIKSPECFEVEKKLRERMSIPVFHDDQHGTAIVPAAAVYNGLRIVDKRIEKVKLVASGSGVASIVCVDLLVSMGLPKANIMVCDRGSVIYKGRSLGMIRSVTDATLVGSFISGLAQPAHVMIPSISSRSIFNPSAAAAADIKKRKTGETVNLRPLIAPEDKVTHQLLEKTI